MIDTNGVGLSFPASIATAIALLVVVATLLPLIRRGYWWIRVCDYPRLQIATLGLLTLAGLYALEMPVEVRWAVGLPLLIAVAYQFYLIVPFSPFMACQVKKMAAGQGGDRLSILVANVYTPNRRADDLIRIAGKADPDLFLVLEPDAWWQEQLDALEERYPHNIKQPLDNTYGMLLYSRLPLSQSTCRFLVHEGIPSIRAYLHLPSGNRVLFYGLHPNPPQFGLDTFGRDAELVIAAREIQEHPGPVIVAGDMNDVAWSHTTRLFLRLSGLLDPRIGRGLFSTYNAKISCFRWPLDHVFHGSCFRLVNLQRLGFFGSDHFPLYCELALDYGAEEVHDEPEADTEDHLEARRLIEEGEEDPGIKLSKG